MADIKKYQIIEQKGKKQLPTAPAVTASAATPTAPTTSIPVIHESPSETPSNTSSETNVTSVQSNTNSESMSWLSSTVVAIASHLKNVLIIK